MSKAQKPQISLLKNNAKSQFMSGQVDVLELAAQHRCQQCKIKFSKADDLKKHEERHSNGKIKVRYVQTFKCSQCEEKFRSLEELRSHKATHINLERVNHHLNQRTKTFTKFFKCGQCDELFRSVEELKSHKITHVTLDRIKKLKEISVFTKDHKEPFKFVDINQIIGDNSNNNKSSAEPIQEVDLISDDENDEEKESDKSFKFVDVLNIIGNNVSAKAKDDTNVQEVDLTFDATEDIVTGGEESVKLKQDTEPEFIDCSPQTVSDDLAIENVQKTLGCSRCRFSKRGCKTCKSRAISTEIQIGPVAEDQTGQSPAVEKLARPPGKSPGRPVGQNSERPYHCLHCDKTYKRPDHLKNHQKTAHTAFFFPEQITVTRNRRSLPTADFHSDPDFYGFTDEESTPSKKARKSHDCPKCSESFPKESQLKSHRNTISCIDQNDFFANLRLMPWTMVQAESNVCRRSKRRSIRKSL